MGQSRLRRLVHNAAGGVCYWCQRRVYLVKGANGKLPPYASTVDHMDQKLDGLRGKRLCEVVCACHECNQKRSAESVAAHRSSGGWDEPTVPNETPQGMIIDNHSEFVLLRVKGVDVKPDPPTPVPAPEPECAEGAISKQRKRVFERDNGRCKFCYRQVRLVPVPVGQYIHDDIALVYRRKFNQEPPAGTIRNVLACAKCCRVEQQKGLK